MSIRTFIFITIGLLLPIFISASNIYTREHKLNERVTIFSEDEGKLWGAKVDDIVILQPRYSGIDLLGDNLLKLIAYDAEAGKLLYGFSDYHGAVKQPCEYEYLTIENGRVRAFRPATAQDISKAKSASKSPPEVDGGQPNARVFERVTPMSVVEYMDGETDSPSMDLELIRNTIDKINEPKSEVDKMPSFPGGEEKMHQFIKDNLEYPENARLSGIEGRVVVRFVVMPNGRVGRVEILQSLEASCDREAMRIVEMMPRWSAGAEKGKRVPVYCTLAISFSL